MILLALLITLVWDAPDWKPAPGSVNPPLVKYRLYEAFPSRRVAETNLNQLWAQVDVNPFADHWFFVVGVYANGRETPPSNYALFRDQTPPPPDPAPTVPPDPTPTPTPPTPTP